DEQEQQRRIDELERENAELRGRPLANGQDLPAPEAERVITPTESEVIPPSEQSDHPRNQGYAPDLKDSKPPVTIDGKPLRPGMGPDGKPIPPQAVSGDEAKRRMAASNADRSLTHKVMNAPSRVAHEPQPSSPLTTHGDSGFHWNGSRGRSW